MTAEGAEEKPIPVAGSALPNDGHVLRHIRSQFVDGENIDGNGFLRRKNEDDGSSVNWLEWFEPPPENQVSGVRGLARLKPGAAAKLVSINVGQTIQYVISQHPDNLALSFVHDPLEVEGDYRADPSHSLIKGLPVNDGPEAELVKDLLVDCIQARYPAKVKAT